MHVANIVEDRHPQPIDDRDAVFSGGKPKRVAPDRLGDAWYPVQQGDVIWMAPFCPQWFVAMGKAPARYLYYKDVNRDSLEGLSWTSRR